MTTNESVEFMLKSIFRFNSIANDVFKSNMLYWEYKPVKEVMEFTVYWTDKNGSGRHRFDYDIDAETINMSYADMVADVRQQVEELYIWELTGVWPENV